MDKTKLDNLTQVTIDGFLRNLAHEAELYHQLRDALSVVLDYHVMEDNGVYFAINNQKQIVKFNSFHDALKAIVDEQS